MKEVAIGKELVQEITVENNMSAKALGSGSLDVFATPSLVAFMENTAMNLIGQFLDDGETTVGSQIDVLHLSPTPINMKVTCVAKIIEVDGKKVVFEINANDEKSAIGKASHTRFVVDSCKFQLKTDQKF